MIGKSDNSKYEGVDRSKSTDDSTIDGTILSSEQYTLTYYDRHCADFIEGTQSVDFGSIQSLFLSYVKPGGWILDLGCGAGRDSRYFLERGFQVEAVDGSIEICKAASAYLGIPVKQRMFRDLDEHNRYNGIWACASILHMKKTELPGMFIKIRDALKENGVFYTSFKYGAFEGIREERYYTDLTEESLMSMVRETPGFEIIKMWITKDVRKDRRDHKWINILLKKTTGT